MWVPGCYPGRVVLAKGVARIVRPQSWHPPIEPTSDEQVVIKLIKRAKLFVFLREHRHEIFDEDFQEQLGVIYRESRLGQPPVPPAKLALATILQAYTGVSEDEAIEAMVMDRRWQLVLDSLEEREAPFSKGTLVNFRKVLIEHELDRRLIERTVEVARSRGGFGSGRLRAALDSSPLWGAGRVEDTYNLLGHALRKAVGMIARQQGRGLAEVAEEAGAEVLVGGAGSLKAALDLDWDDPEQRTRALVRVLGALEAIEEYCSGEYGAFSLQKRRKPDRPSRPRGACESRTWRKRPTGRPACAGGWRVSGKFRWRTQRCAMAEKAKAAASTVTNATCCATLTPSWSGRWG
jgi:hypothetical protein